jgi:hypothetical protein
MLQATLDPAREKTRAGKLGTGQILRITGQILRIHVRDRCGSKLQKLRAKARAETDEPNHFLAGTGQLHPSLAQRGAQTPAPKISRETRDRSKAGKLGTGQISRIHARDRLWVEIANSERRLARRLMNRTIFGGTPHDSFIRRSPNETRKHRPQNPRSIFDLSLPRTARLQMFDLSLPRTENQGLAGKEGQIKYCGIHVRDRLRVETAKTPRGKTRDRSNIAHPCPGQVWVETAKAPSGGSRGD